MLFAAFEKKWWKALVGDQDSMSDRKDLNADLDEVNSVSDDDSPSEISEIEQAVSMTSAKEWKEGEDFIENVDNRLSDLSSETEDDESEDDEFENVSTEYVEEGAFDLEGKEMSDDDYYEDEEEEERPKVRDDIQSVKEFFNTEVLYRFDILDDERRKDLVGRYRIEVRGDKGGVWTLDLTENNINVTPQREEADLVLMLHSEDFLSIVNGFLNPQIALVSQRVKVSGDSKKASLFQNIMSPLGDW